jgi:tol-pal system protein YbgF
MPQRMSRFVKFAVVLALFALAARTQETRAQDSVSDLDARVDRLEEVIRNLTGAIEQLQYQNRQLQQQVQNLEAARQPGSSGSAVQYAPPSRPSYSAPPPPAQDAPPPQYAPQAQTGSRRHDAFNPAAPNAVGPPEPLGTDATDADAAPDSGRHDAFNPALAPGAPGAPRALGTSTGANEPPPRYEPPASGRGVADASDPQAQSPSGALPPPPPINPSATGAMPAAPGNMPKDDYGLAYNYFQQKDYVRAADTFNAFVRQHPGDRLTPEAQYWLGEALYRTRRYHDAAEAFLTVSTKYEANARAPDALLRLGQSLAALGQKEAACASLGEVLRKYPRASSSVKGSVAREQKRVHC